MSINCSRYCNDELFMSHLNRLRISKDSHCRTEDSLETLISCLSTRCREASVREIVNALTTEREEGHSAINVDIDSLMFLGSQFEYGNHSGMYFNNSKSVLGLLMALSRALNLTIFLICGSLPLRIIHKDKYILRFNHSEQPSQKVVIGLVGLSIFHLLKQPEENSSTWEILLRDSKEISESLFEALSRESFIEDDIFVSDNFEEEIMERRQPKDSRISINGSSINENIEKSSILDFIDFHSSEVVDKRIKIDDSAYDCRERIDFDCSSANDFLNNPISELNFLFDIDGFFGFSEWNDSGAFKGDVVLSNIPEFECKKEERTCKQLLSTNLNVSVDNMVFFKIGVSIGVKNMFFDVCFSAILAENDFLSNSRILRSHASTAFTYGLDAPCFDAQTQTNLHPGCDCRTYRSVLDAHTNTSIRKKINFSNSRYKCFKYHFFQKLQELCSKHEMVFIKCFEYLQSVGSKNKLFSDTVNGIYNQIMVLNSTVNLEKITAYYDVAFSVIARTSDPETNVNKSDINLLYFLYLGIFALET